MNSNWSYYDISLFHCFTTKFCWIWLKIILSNVFLNSDENRTHVNLTLIKWKKKIFRESKNYVLFYTVPLVHFHYSSLTYLSREMARSRHSINIKMFMCGKRTNLHKRQVAEWLKASSLKPDCLCLTISLALPAILFYVSVLFVILLSG